MLVPEKIVEKNWEGIVTMRARLSNFVYILIKVLKNLEGLQRGPWCTKGRLRICYFLSAKTKAWIQISHLSILSSFYEITLVSHTNSSDGIIYFIFCYNQESLSFPGCVIRSFSLSSCRCNTATIVGGGGGWDWVEWSWGFFINIRLNLCRTELGTKQLSSEFKYKRQPMCKNA